jgi:serine/threonine protein kinase
MINAIDFFHQMGLCHRDLKIENILVDDQFNLRFIDFGMTKSLADLLDE